MSQLGICLGRCFYLRTEKEDADYNQMFEVLIHDQKRRLIIHAPPVKEIKGLTIICEDLLLKEELTPARIYVRRKDSLFVQGRNVTIYKMRPDDLLKVSYTLETDGIDFVEQWMKMEEEHWRKKNVL